MSIVGTRSPPQSILNEQLSASRLTTTPRLSTVKRHNSMRKSLEPSISLTRNPAIPSDGPGEPSVPRLPIEEEWHFAGPPLSDSNPSPSTAAPFSRHSWSSGFDSRPSTADGRSSPSMTASPVRYFRRHAFTGTHLQRACSTPPRGRLGAVGPFARAGDILKEEMAQENEQI
ncbi:hypothetical protein CLOM_g8463 [Closterium sp. NIES-68]|nr:hypothetical protein CLOM_g4465 [Closterium sp. NIES-68]GJP49225.1 hypothetical protein CLOM_g8463 [Closterium sp. NIES-68]GJP82007.1 hypothetical protein CLOP_g12129 [Closterium sp. NIES-67]